MLKRNLQNELSLAEIRNSVFRDLDDLVAKEDEIDIGKKIGAGASSEVFYGNFKFCPCAVKKIRLGMMNAKQIVSSPKIPIKLTLIRNSLSMK